MKRIETVLFSNMNVENEKDFDFNFELECFMGELSLSEYDTDCVVCGSLGLWYGRREIYPQKFTSLLDAIRTTFRSADFVEVKQVNGHIEVTAVHHDGRNYFEIYLLNEKGLFTQNGNLENRRYHRAIKGYIF